MSDSQTTPPTEAMCDAARPLFLYFAAGSTRMTLGQHMAAGGWSVDGLTADQLAHAGLFPKVERAAMVWSVMEAARGKQS
jgi:hypothetical protein